MNSPDTARRLQVLRELDLLDCAPEERFDRITRLAARVFGVPTAFLTLAGPERQWCKSRFGPAIEDGVLEQVFGLDAIGRGGVPVADAAAHPTPDGMPTIRFHAACPVEAQGVTVGALCLADTAPRAFGDEERALLRDLAAMAAGELAAGALRRDAERRRAFFRTASHELRTPTASIFGFSELLLKRGFDAATGRELLGIIHTQSARLVALTGQMADLARIEAGGADEAPRTAASLSALALDAVAAAVPPARAGDVSVGAAPELPAVCANPVWLHQALAAILANAVQFSTPGSRIALAFAPAARDGRPGASVAVRDHGVGMTADQRARMFEAFYRAGEHPEMEGAGLGLALVQRIVAFHEGAIEVESHPGAGTTVTVWIPAAREPA